MSFIRFSFICVGFHSYQFISMYQFFELLPDNKEEEDFVRAAHHKDHIAPAPPSCAKDERPTSLRLGQCNSPSSSLPFLRTS